MFRIRTTTQSDHSVLHPEGTVRKISKPVKITELIGSCKQSRNNQPNSTIKINLPERITPYLKSASNRKRNETNTHVKSSQSKKNVRRNLNFTKIPAPMVKTETSVTTNRNNLIDSSREENSYLSTRKSCLIPPNTVKDLYIKDRFRQNKSMLPQSHISTYSVYDNKCHKRLERLESSFPLEVTNMQIDSVIHEKVNKTRVQHISSQMCTVNNQSGIDILYTNYTDIKDDAIGNVRPESLINIEEKKCLSMTDNSRKDLHQSTQDVQAINQPCLNLNHITNKNEYIILNKTILIDLESKLKHNICQLEEDILPHLRFTHSTILDILSATNITNKETDNNDTKIMQQMTENLKDHIKITNNINTKSLCVSSNINTEENINIEKSIIEDSNSQKKIYETPDTNLMKLVKADVYEKNNSEIQLSHQIDLPFENNKENDSFVDLENKLDITNIKSSTTIVSVKKSIPVLNKYETQEKPLKEYMALKSRMSCLLTPNVKHFNCSQSKINLHSESGDAKASLSGKILAELYHLYEDNIDPKDSNS